MLQVIDRYHPQRRRQLQEAVDAGRFETCDELELLGEEQLLPLARQSLFLLIAGGVALAVLNMLTYFWHYGQWFPSLSWGSVFLWVVVSISSYIIILPVHEAIHALAILFWGGRPHFGLKLPLALFCGARAQLFRRDQYRMIALAPLVVLTVAGLLVLFWQPGLAGYLWFALAGNISGAAGDILVAQRVRRFPAETLFEDTETGYRALRVHPETI
ncbi:putative zincin peptidase [Thermosporothrix hazakensis]|jgi:hypothetical protein|uniref:DUF3267 domain-containing protein n=2 Tax=Thermosporothrix TaxID=768650 RepID=A0A455SUK6_9CHLR|nr:DUF3267 domain-containing protein [Thermosporothrix hazakensis]PZW32870.1 putative zincin peptidase [Thermosporothrix hazakensis]BBH90851.1 hypothetical protein KTC_56020 [Thermosporothrix sp. COM3]GCE48902.1 hypothetical protein KTH_37710 [Thermosporothrix hazakensis]